MGQVQYKKADGTPIDQLDLAYDAEGNIISKELANGSLNQDSALTASFDAANRMTAITVSGKTYVLTYDANGNLTQKQNTADASDVTIYAWDSRNRLTGLTAPGLAASFAYDPLGRRIERTVNGETTAYLYDGIQAIGEVRAGQATALLTGLAVDEAIARYASSGRLTQLTDQLGSVIRQINEAGATQSATAYSPYGEVATTGNDLGNSTEYTGRENDGTGLYFYRARYYDPVLKRFVSEDPIGVVGGVNIYKYVGGNPIIHTDPSGNFLVPGMLIGGIAGAYGAWVQSGCWKDILIGAGVGAATGALGGGLASAAGLIGGGAGAGLGAIGGSAISAMGSFVGQVSAGGAGNVNAAAVGGAALGGAFAGAYGAIGAGIAGDMLGAQIGAAAGFVGDKLGKTVDESLGKKKPKRKCGC